MTLQGPGDVADRLVLDSGRTCRSTRPCLPCCTMPVPGVAAAGQVGGDVHIVGNDQPRVVLDETPRPIRRRALGLQVGRPRHRDGAALGGHDQVDRLGPPASSPAGSPGPPASRSSPRHGRNAGRHPHAHDDGDLVAGPARWRAAGRRHESSRRRCPTGRGRHGSQQRAEHPLGFLPVGGQPVHDGRGARPSSHGSIQGAAIRPPFRSIAKISTSAQRASWPSARQQVRLARAAAGPRSGWPSRAASPRTPGRPRTARPGSGWLMLSGSSPAAGNGTVSPSTSRSTTCRVTL